MRRELARAASLVAWIVAILAGIALILLLFPWSSIGGYRSAKSSSDLSNIKQSGIANLMYMSDHDGYGPPPDQWMDVLAPYVKNDLIFTSPGLDQDAGEYGYAYLRELGGIRLEDVLYPAKVP
ncbi:MAG: hypothetical protein IH945_10320, partial [Armatimonadetes bacterium]|nr:hypothetical protein [Armatimonadota bacterium]